MLKAVERRRKRRLDKKKGARLELRDELPGQRWNKGLQAIIPGIGPVIHWFGRVGECGLCNILISDILRVRFG